MEESKKNNMTKIIIGVIAVIILIVVVIIGVNINKNKKQEKLINEVGLPQELPNNENPSSVLQTQEEG